MKIHFKPYIVLLILLTLFFSCHTESDELLDTQTILERQTSKTVTADQIPDIISFVETQSNKNLSFTLNNSVNGQNRSEENLIIGSLNTERIQQITNSENRTNYTFTMEKESPSQEASIINYVVKENGDSYYSYFLEFVPDANWLHQTTNPNDLSQYTGEIKVYDRNGSYVTNDTFVDGQSIAQTGRQSCDPVNGDNETSDGNGGSTGGNPSSGDGGFGGNGDVTDNGNGGQDIECVIITIEDCNCSDGPGTVVIVSACNGQKSAVRNPCTDDCNAQNDCEFGFDANCNCLENPDNAENAEVLIDVETFFALESLLGGNDSFQYPADVDPDNAIHFDSVEEFAEFLQGAEFDLTLPVTEQQNGNRITTFRVDYGLTNVDLFVNQILNDPSINQEYELIEVSSEVTGITLGFTWDQTAIEYIIEGNEAIITVFGNLKYNLFLESVGTIYTDVKIFELHIDINTGQPISIFDIED
ncbi:hypothetical protein [uncultured Dokdonia sp.]|uniref:hypothetical protein n=1 Tax=uncultured Dokdonia sp. TaxID=575653 RepID=UPI00260837FD|nr:hypothetical protein [uncultured Dokdonia sp.]